MNRLDEGSDTDTKTRPKNTEGMQEEPGVKRTVDELMQDHVDFLATCLKECMLTNSKLLKVS